MAGADTRNVAFVGHGSAGKTTLCEAFLFRGGAITRQGNVSDRNTTSDFIEDEHERGHSIEIGVMHVDWKGKNFQLLDAPGYPDFQGQAIRALDGADLAIVVIDAYDGVGLNARKLYGAAERAGIPRLVVINNCDHDNIDEAIAQANSLDVSFQAAVFSKNIDTCMHAFKQLDASAVMINDHTAFRVDWMPFAGLKHSGHGVGGIPHTFKDMQIEKMMVIRSPNL